MTPSFARRAVCVAACLSAIGCAGPGRFEAAGQGAGSARTTTGQTVGPETALGLVAVDKSTKTDVSTALGNAIVIPFDSGYAVWVYRWPHPQKPDRWGAELVVLFAPSGIVAKVRLRPEFKTLD